MRMKAGKHVDKGFCEQHNAEEVWIPNQRSKAGRQAPREPTAVYYNYCRSPLGPETIIFFTSEKAAQALVASGLLNPHRTPMGNTANITDRFFLRLQKIVYGLSWPLPNMYSNARWPCCAPVTGAGQSTTTESGPPTCYACSFSRQFGRR